MLLMTNGRVQEHQRMVMTDGLWWCAAYNLDVAHVASIDSARQGGAGRETAA